jgi:hypothetical protein
MSKVEPENLDSVSFGTATSVRSKRKARLSPRFVALLLNRCIHLLRAAARIAEQARERSTARRVRRALKSARAAHREAIARRIARGPYARSRRRPR